MNSNTTHLEINECVCLNDSGRMCSQLMTQAPYESYSPKDGFVVDYFYLKSSILAGRRTFSEKYFFFFALLSGLLFLFCKSPELSSGIDDD